MLDFLIIKQDFEFYMEYIFGKMYFIRGNINRFDSETIIENTETESTNSILKRYSIYKNETKTVTKYTGEGANKSGYWERTSNKRCNEINESRFNQHLSWLHYL